MIRNFDFFSESFISEKKSQLFLNLVQTRQLLFTDFGKFHVKNQKLKLKLNTENPIKFFWHIYRFKAFTFDINIEKLYIFSSKPIHIYNYSKLNSLSYIDLEKKFF
jgi:hypothetical protein